MGFGVERTGIGAFGLGRKLRFAPASEEIGCFAPLAQTHPASAIPGGGDQKKNFLERNGEHSEIGQSKTKRARKKTGPPKTDL